jgi:Methane/Phenol/Toluene Hydroxylase/TCP-1/cpn60 chaperonin family
VDNGRKNGTVKRFDKSWVSVLQNHVGALKHAEFGLGTLYMYAQRDGMSQMINTSTLTNASYKLRFAQDLTLYLAEAALDLEKFDLEAGKEHWLNDPIWQGARQAIETVHGAEDYLEQYFAGNLLFEPLVTELVRSGLVMQFAAAHGDFVTPAIVEDSLSAVRAAIQDGVLSGGGTAFAYVSKDLGAPDGPSAEGFATGVRIVQRALLEPIRCIARNSGLDPDEVANRVVESNYGFGLNARTGQFEDLQAAGILDPLQSNRNIAAQRCLGRETGAGHAHTYCRQA